MERRVTRGNLLLLLASLAVAAVLAEVALRIAGYHGDKVGDIKRLRLVDDELLDFRHVPNATWIHNGLLYEINAHGWRDHFYSFEKPAGTFRIIVVGDSVTHGYGVELEQIYAKQLEARLAEASAGVRYEVILLTVGAINTVQEAHLVEIEGLRYSPDLVVVGYVLNDPAPGASLRRYRDERHSATVRLKKLLRRSSLLHLLYRSGQELVWALRVGLGRELVAEYVRRDYFSRLHATPERWASVEEGMDRMSRVSREKGIPFVWMIFPVLHELADYQLLPVHRQVEQAAQARGFAVLDLLPEFRRYRAHDLQVDSGDHVHPNPLGHRLAAEALLRFLRRERMLTEPVDTPHR